MLHPALRATRPLLRPAAALRPTVPLLRPAKPLLGVDECDKLLTYSGSPFETERVNVDGRDLRVWKNVSSLRRPELTKDATLFPPVHQREHAKVGPEAAPEHPDCGAGAIRSPRGRDLCGCVRQSRRSCRRAGRAWGCGRDTRGRRRSKQHGLGRFIPRCLPCWRGARAAEQWAARRCADALPPAHETASHPRR